MIKYITTRIEYDDVIVELAAMDKDTVLCSIVENVPCETCAEEECDFEHCKFAKLSEDDLDARLDKMTPELNPIADKMKAMMNA